MRISKMNNWLRPLRYTTLLGVVALSVPGSLAFLPATASDDDRLGAQPLVERPFIAEPPPVLAAPPIPSPQRPRTPTDPPTLGRGSYGIPASALSAYKRAAEQIRTQDPGCHLDWPVLAGIGKVESAHARGGAVDRHGDTVRPVVGLPLNGGNGTARISDTDNGRYDGDPVFDRAVGPMQFIPSTWRRWGSDGNGDGKASPSNVYDATLSAGRYLCVGGRDLSSSRGLTAGLLSYNHSMRYVALVRGWINAYRLSRGVPVPDGSGGFLPIGSATTPTAPAPAKPKKTAPAKPKQTDRKSAPPSSPAPAPAPSPTPRPALPAPVTDVVDDPLDGSVGDVLGRTTTSVSGLLGGSG